MSKARVQVPRRSPGAQEERAPELLFRNLTVEQEEIENENSIFFLYIAILDHLCIKHAYPKLFCLR